MAPSDVDYYKVLGLARYASEDEIKKAWRKAARDTHPDKNPDDPNSKQKFQELQQAYDTLKDKLERSKYDEDNPHHGRFGADAPKARSSTAKRYTGSAASATPAWNTGTGPSQFAGGPPPFAGTSFSGGNPFPSGSSTFGGGFPHQSTRHSHKPQPNPAYGDDRGYGGYASSQKTRSGFGYTTGGFRASPRPTDYEDYEDYRSYDRRESAYSHTFRADSKSSRPKSTPGTQSSYNPENPASNEGTPDYDLNAYIRERRAREIEMEDRQRRKEAEESRREAERQRAERMARKNEHIAREAEKARLDNLERKHRSRKREEEAQKIAEEVRRTEAEARRGQGHDKSRHAWNEPARKSSMRDGYTSAEQSDSGPFNQSGEDEILRKVNEELKGKKFSRPGSTVGGGASKRRDSKKTSPTKPKERKSTDFESFHSSSEHAQSDWWKKGSHQTANQMPREKMTFDESLRVEKEKQERQEKQEKQEAENPRSSKDNSRKSDEFLKAQSSKSTHGVDNDQTPRPKSVPAHANSKNAEPEFKTPPTSPPKVRKLSTGIGKPDDNNRSEGISDFKFYNLPNTYALDPNDTGFSEPNASERSSPFSKKPDFSFHGEEVPSPFNYVVPETPQEQDEPPAFKSQRPQSQPIYPTQPIPSPSLPPQPQQPPQQQPQKPQQYFQPPFDKFNRTLWNTLIGGAGFFSPPAQAPSKKKSAPNFKTKTKSRERSRSASVDKGYFSNVQATAETDSESDRDIKGKKNAKEKTGIPNLNMNGTDFEPVDETIFPDIASKYPLPRSTGTTPVNGASHSKNSDGIDPLSKPPSRSPADVGLDGLDLPFSIKSPSVTPIPSLRGNFPKPPPPFPDLRNLYEPPTPADESFDIPKAPEIPVLPKEMTLDSWNLFFKEIEPYMTRWKDYDANVDALRSRLVAKGVEAPVSFNEASVRTYANRVRNKDMLLEESYRKAREEHLRGMESWLRCQNTVTSMKRH
ncbi:unfolded protein binding [Rhizina undulata]